MSEPYPRFGTDDQKNDWLKKYATAQPKWLAKTLVPPDLATQMRQLGGALERENRAIKADLDDAHRAFVAMLRRLDRLEQQLAAMERKR